MLLINLRKKRVNEPKYIPGNPVDGTIEKRDAWEAWWYETYVKHCEEGDCPGCDKCVPYHETMNGRFEGMQIAHERKIRNESKPAPKPNIIYDYKLKAYVDTTQGKLVKR